MVTSLVLSLVIGPFISATGYRLGAQYVAGEAPNPFEPGLLALAWRFLLVGVAWLALYLGAAVLIVAFFAIAQAVVGGALTFLLVAIGVVVASLLMVVRLSLAPVMVLSGAGPIAALRSSWDLTRGHFGVAFRWLFVTGLLVAVIGGLIGAALGLVAGAIGQPQLGQLASGLITGPVLVLQAIIQILLARLLSGPIEQHRPGAAPNLDERFARRWMTWLPVWPGTYHVPVRHNPGRGHDAATRRARPAGAPT